MESIAGKLPKFLKALIVTIFALFVLAIFGGLPWFIGCLAMHVPDRFTIWFLALASLLILALLYANYYGSLPSSKTHDGLQFTLCPLIRTVSQVVAVVASVTAATAMALWMSEFIFKPGGTYVGGSLFTLAQVVAIFGAFGIAGALAGLSDDKLGRRLGQAGVLHLLPALGFTLLGLMLPASTNNAVWDRYSTILAPINGGVLFVGMLGFSLGTFLWVSQIPKLLNATLHRS